MTNYLKNEGHDNLLLPSHAELELTDRVAVDAYFAHERPEYVILAAAKVGGIHANDAYPADFIFQNLAIQCNVIDAAYRANVEKLIFFGSACMYPRLAAQPISEDAFLSGPLEPTNEAYAAAKIAGTIMCQSYRRQYGFNAVCLVPTNLYGPGDNFDPNASHVIPALMRRAHQAKLDNAPNLTIWGTGAPRREFMHVNDLSKAIIFAMKSIETSDLLNVGTGSDIDIKSLAHEVCGVVGYKGEIIFDTTKPDGMPKKMLDSARFHALGWKPETYLLAGLSDTYQWFLDNIA